MDNDQKPIKRPKFWIGPLLAGICFALGYGFIKRVDTFRGFWPEQSPKLFEHKPFPALSLSKSKSLSI